MNPELRDAYQLCAQITREHGTTYYWGVRLLPSDQRNDVYAMYAMCRLADDIVDSPHATTAAYRDATALRLHGFASSFRDGVSTGNTHHPVIQAAVETARRRDIPSEVFDRFFGAMTQDLTVTSYPTYEDLLRYMDGSAAVIGEMMLPILHPLQPAALGPARALGLAFQLTNFLRDVVEDDRRGRTYIPTEDFERFGVAAHPTQVTEPWRALMEFEIARTRELYDEADRGLQMLPARAARCVYVARQLYSQILDRIEQSGYDVFSARHRVPTWRKASLASRALVLPATLALPTTSTDDSRKGTS